MDDRGYAYLITVDPTLLEFTLCAFIDVSAMLGHDEKSYSQFRKAAESMLEDKTKSPLPDEHEVARIPFYMEMRQRFSGEKLLLVKSDCPMEAKDFECLLSTMKTKEARDEFIARFKFNQPRRQKGTSYV